MVIESRAPIEGALENPGLLLSYTTRTPVSHITNKLISTLKSTLQIQWNSSEAAYNDDDSTTISASTSSSSPSSATNTDYAGLKAYSLPQFTTLSFRKNYFYGQVQVCLSLSLRFRGLFLYTGGYLFNVEWFIRQLWCSSIILCNIITSVAYNLHTNIYPLLNIKHFYLLTGR